MIIVDNWLTANEPELNRYSEVFSMNIRDNQEIRFIYKIYAENHQLKEPIYLKTNIEINNENNEYWRNLMENNKQFIDL